MLKKAKMLTAVLAIAGLVLALAPAAQAAITILNPSFESPDQGGGAGRTPITGPVTLAGLR